MLSPPAESDYYAVVTDRIIEARRKGAPPPLRGRFRSIRFDLMCRLPSSIPAPFSLAVAAIGDRGSCWLPPGSARMMPRDTGSGVESDAEAHMTGG